MPGDRLGTGLHYEQDPKMFRHRFASPVAGKAAVTCPHFQVPASASLHLCSVTQHMQESQGFRSSQHGFMKGRSCLIHLISFYDEVTHLVDEVTHLSYFYFFLIVL